MFTDTSSINNNIMKQLSTAELIEAYESAKRFELSEDFQKMLSHALKLREEMKTEDLSDRL